MEKYVLLLDTPGIKKYVFGASALKDIRGASAILDGLNRGWLLSSQSQKQEDVYRDCIQNVSGLKLSQFVYANGGSGLCIVESPDERALLTLEKQLQKLYRQHTKNAVTIMVAWAKYDGQLQQSLDQAHWELRRKRSQIEPVMFPSTPWARFDEDLKTYRAERLFRGVEKNRWVSAVSLSRKKFASKEKRRVWQEFREFLQYDVEPPESLEEIAGEGNENDIAVVYADGNSMGKHIRTLQTPQEYADFSQKIDSAVRNAVFSAMQELFSEMEKTKKAPFDIILLGGDDILVVLPRKSAADFVLKVSQKFLEETKKFAEETNRKFSLSFGIAVGKYNYPFAQLVDQAEECLKNAKTSWSDQAAVDFHVNRSGFYPDVHDYREKEFIHNDFNTKLICRPFTMDMFEKYVVSVRNLIAKDVPASRLYNIATSLKKGKIMGHVGWIQGVGRARKDEQKKALHDLLQCWQSNGLAPWHITNASDESNKLYECGFYDVLELYDMLS